MSNQQLLDQLKEVASHTLEVEGWDFSCLEKWGGKPEFPLPWDYHQIVSNYIKGIPNLLDMGTGGGEFLATLSDLPKKTYATESFSPNVVVAQKRLAPLDVEVVPVEKGSQENALLPFDDASLDLVICRHDFYDSKEVFRVLTSGGTFITQQVGSQDLDNLKLIFGNIDPNEWSIEVAKDYLIAAGFYIQEDKQQIAPTRFYDIRTIVYYLQKLKWNFPDFTLDQDDRRIQNINTLIRKGGYFEDKCHRFLIVAKKGMS